MRQRMYLKKWISVVAKYIVKHKIHRPENVARFKKIMDTFTLIYDTQQELKRKDQTILGVLPCNIGFFPTDVDSYVIMKVFGQSTYFPEPIDIFTLNIPKQIVYDIFGEGEVEMSLRTKQYFKRDISFEI